MERRSFMKAAAGAATVWPALASAATPADRPARRDFLVRGGYVVSMDSRLGDMPMADVLVVDGRIAEVGRNLSAPAGAAVIDGSGMIVSPGFVNGHIHLAQTMQRGVSTEHTFADYYSTLVLKYSNRMSPDDVRLAEYVGALEQVSLGTTTLMDWNREAMTPEHAEAAVDGLLDSGVRAIFAYTIAARTPQGSEAPLRRMLDHARSLRVGRLSSDQGRVTLGACLPGPDFMPLEPAFADMRMLRDLQVLTSFHCAAPIYAQRKQGLIATLARQGLLDGRLQLVHANDLDAGEFRLAADQGACMVSTPEAELHCGHGHPAIWKAARARVPVSLGTDIPSAFGGGMMTQMRTALAAEIARLNALSFAETGKAPAAKAVSARDMLDLATAGGAKALGLGDVTGSITAGKRADLLLIRSDSVATAPMLDPVGTLVLQATPADIDTVIVDGRVLKAGGRMADPRIEPAARELRQRALRMVQRAQQA